MGDNEALWYPTEDHQHSGELALYDGFECAVVEEDATSEWFELTTGVKQGCTMSGFLFLLIIDWVMRHTVKKEGTGLRCKFT